MREPNLPLCERYLKLCIQQKLLLLGTHDFVQRNFVAYQVGRRESFLNNNSSNNNNNDQASSKIFFVENCLSVERQLSSTAKKDLTLIIRVRSSLGRGVRWLEWVGGGGATLGEKTFIFLFMRGAISQSFARSQSLLNYGFSSKRRFKKIPSKKLFKNVNRVQ